MPRTRPALDVEAGSYPPDASKGGGSFAALAVFALVGVAGTAGAVFYVQTQLSALQVSFDKQRQQTDDAFVKHVTALQELHRAQEDVRKLAGMAGKAAPTPKANEDEEVEDRKTRRRKEAKEAKAKAKAKDEEEDEEKDENAKGRGKKAKDEEGEDDEKDEVGPRHWAGVAASPNPSPGGPFMVRDGHTASPDATVALTRRTARTRRGPRRIRERAGGSAAAADRALGHGAGAFVSACSSLGGGGKPRLGGGANTRRLGVHRPM